MTSSPQESNKPFNDLLCEIRTLLGPPNKPDTQIVLRCSGGCDSMAMLFVLNKAGYNFNVVYFDHPIRPIEQREKDRDVIRSLMRQLSIDLEWNFKNIPLPHHPAGANAEAFYSGQRDMHLETEFGGNYAMYNNTAITAHHADDQLETMLMRLARGSGVAAMSGIQRIKLIGGTASNPIRLVRPGLVVRKADLYRICKDNNIEFNYDSTNDDTRILRNEMRRTLMPELNRIFPNIALASVKSASIFAESAKITAEVFSKFMERDVYHKANNNYKKYSFEYKGPEFTYQILNRIADDLSGADAIALEEFISNQWDQLDRAFKTNKPISLDRGSITIHYDLKAINVIIA